MYATPTSYADRILNVSVTGPLIRIELGTITPPAAEGQRPDLHPTQTLVLPLDGFLASYGMLETIIKRMVDQGMVKSRAPGDAAAPAAVEAPAETGKKAK